MIVAGKTKNTMLNRNEPVVKAISGTIMARAEGVLYTDANVTYGDTSYAMMTHGRVNYYNCPASVKALVDANATCIQVLASKGLIFVK